MGKREIKEWKKEFKFPEDGALTKDHKLWRDDGEELSKWVESLYELDEEKTANFVQELLSERYEVGCKDGARGFFEGVLKHLEDREETKDSIKGRIELSKVLLEVYKIDLSKLLKEGE